MTREETIKWLESLKAEIGKSEHRTLWHYAEAIDMAIEVLQGKSINCNYTCSDCVHQNKSYEEEPCHSCFNNDGAGYVPNLWEEKK